MKKKLHAFQFAVLWMITAGLFASCSRQTAYNSLPSTQLQVQQVQVPTMPTEKMDKIAITANEVIIAQESMQALQPVKMKTKKLNSVNKLKTKIGTTVSRKNIENKMADKFSFAVSKSTMSAKANPDNGLASVGIIFLILGLLSFIIPPLFLTSLTVPGAQMLVIVAIGLIAVGLLFMATGIARKAEK